MLSSHEETIISLIKVISQKQKVVIVQLPHFFISAAWTKQLIFMFNLTIFFIIIVCFCLFFYLFVLNQIKIRNTRHSQSSNRGCWVESPWRCCVYFHLRWFRRSSAKEAASSWVSLLCSSCQKTGRDWVASSHSTFTVNVFHLWLWPVYLFFVEVVELDTCWFHRNSCCVLNKRMRAEP